MDTGDKSTNKAMSAALKYACLQVFFVPTEGSEDADATSHEVENSLLSKLRDAAMGGTAALRAEFDRLKGSPGLDEVWKQHSKSLKAAAAEADEVVE